MSTFYGDRRDKGVERGASNYGRDARDASRAERRNGFTPQEPEPYGAEEVSTEQAPVENAGPDEVRDMFERRGKAKWKELSQDERKSFVEKAGVHPGTVHTERWEAIPGADREKLIQHLLNDAGAGAGAAPASGGAVSSSSLGFESQQKTTTEVRGKRKDEELENASEHVAVMDSDGDGLITSCGGSPAEVLGSSHANLSCAKCGARVSPRGLRIWNPETKKYEVSNSHENACDPHRFEDGQCVYCGEKGEYAPLSETEKAKLCQKLGISSQELEDRMHRKNSLDQDRSEWGHIGDTEKNAWAHAAGLGSYRKNYNRVLWEDMSQGEQVALMHAPGWGSMGTRQNSAEHDIQVASQKWAAMDSAARAEVMKKAGVGGYGFHELDEIYTPHAEKIIKVILGERTNDAPFHNPEEAKRQLALSEGKLTDMAKRRKELEDAHASAVRGRDAEEIREALLALGAHSANMKMETAVRDGLKKELSNDAVAPGQQEPWSEEMEGVPPTRKNGVNDYCSVCDHERKYHTEEGCTMCEGPDLFCTEFRNAEAAAPAHEGEDLRAEDHLTVPGWEDSTNYKKERTVENAGFIDLPDWELTEQDARVGWLDAAGQDISLAKITWNDLSLDVKVALQKAWESRATPNNKSGEAAEAKSGQGSEAVDAEQLVDEAAETRVRRGQTEGLDERENSKTYVFADESGAREEAAGRTTAEAWGSLANSLGATVSELRNAGVRLVGTKNAREGKGVEAGDRFLCETCNTGFGASFSARIHGEANPGHKVREARADEMHGEPARENAYEMPKCDECGHSDGSHDGLHGKCFEEARPGDTKAVAHPADGFKRCSCQKFVRSYKNTKGDKCPSCGGTETVPLKDGSHGDDMMCTVCDRTWGPDRSKKNANGSRCLKCDKLLPLDQMVKNVHGAGYLCKEHAADWNADERKNAEEKPWQNKSLYCTKCGRVGIEYMSRLRAGEDCPKGDGGKIEYRRENSVAEDAEQIARAAEAIEHEVAEIQEQAPRENGLLTPEQFAQAWRTASGAFRARMLDLVGAPRDMHDVSWDELPEDLKKRLISANEKNFSGRENSSRDDIRKTAEDFKHNGATRASAHDNLLKLFPDMEGDVRMVVDDLWPLHEGHRSNPNSKENAGTSRFSAHLRSGCEQCQAAYEKRPSKMKDFCAVGQKANEEDAEEASRENAASSEPWKNPADYGNDGSCHMCGYGAPGSGHSSGFHKSDCPTLDKEREAYQSRGQRLNRDIPKSEMGEEVEHHIKDKDMKPDQAVAAAYSESGEKRNADFVTAPKVAALMKEVDRLKDAERAALTPDDKKVAGVKVLEALKRLSAAQQEDMNERGLRVDGLKFKNDRRNEGLDRGAGKYGSAENARLPCPYCQGVKVDGVAKDLADHIKKNHPGVTEPDLIAKNIERDGR